MEFFLPFQIPSYPFKISYNDKIIFIGSCFSEEIGNKFKELKLDILQNPNGILYDPLSIADSLISYIEDKPFFEENLFELNGLWHSWKHHSSFSGVTRMEVLKNINRSQAHARDFLRDAKFLIITLGTAFHYQLKNDLRNVANCHKAPSTYFTKNLCSIENITEQISGAISALTSLNPTIKIIFTVSPVRHSKDGVVENNRSKSRLIEAVHSVVEENKNAFYFPSYELITDVLRDYRFYKDDLVHPNETAVGYVFEKFCLSFMDDQSKKIMEEVKKVTLAVNHKAFSEESEAHQKFVVSQIENISFLEITYPFLDFSIEKVFFMNKLKK